MAFKFIIIIIIKTLMIIIDHLQNIKQTHVIIILVLYFNSSFIGT